MSDDYDISKGLSSNLHLYQSNQSEITRIYESYHRVAVQSNIASKGKNPMASSLVMLMLQVIIIQTVIAVELTPEALGGIDELSVIQ